MSETNSVSRPSVGYEADFYAWTQQQAKQLRRLRPNSIDWANLAEEIETLGRSEKREIESRVGVLLQHLLKWRFQPTQRKPGWQATIIEQCRQLQRTLRDNPSLVPYPSAILGEEYEVARLNAADETGLPGETFPEPCPFTLEDVLDPDFWPDAPKP
jgi:hypothetical protein